MNIITVLPFIVLCLIGNSISFPAPSLSYNQVAIWFDSSSGPFHHSLAKSTKIRFASLVDSCYRDTQCRNTALISSNLSLISESLLGLDSFSGRGDLASVLFFFNPNTSSLGSNTFTNQTTNFTLLPSQVSSACLSNFQIAADEIVSACGFKQARSLLIANSSKTTGVLDSILDSLCNNSACSSSFRKWYPLLNSTCTLPNFNAQVKVDGTLNNISLSQLSAFQLDQPSNNSKICHLLYSNSTNSSTPSNQSANSSTATSYCLSHFTNDFNLMYSRELSYILANGSCSKDCNETLSNIICNDCFNQSLSYLDMLNATLNFTNGMNVTDHILSNFTYTMLLPNSSFVNYLLGIKTRHELSKLVNEIKEIGKVRCRFPHLLPPNITTDSLERSITLATNTAITSTPSVNLTAQIHRLDQYFWWRNASRLTTTRVTTTATPLMTTSAWNNTGTLIQTTTSWIPSSTTTLPITSTVPTTLTTSTAIQSTSALTSISRSTHSSETQHTSIASKISASSTFSLKLISTTTPPISPTTVSNEPSSTSPIVLRTTTTSSPFISVITTSRFFNTTTRWHTSTTISTTTLGSLQQI